VDFDGLQYSSEADQTVFSYSVKSSSASGCKQAQAFSIMGSCPSAQCPEASASSEDLEGWSWSFPQALGSTIKYHIYVPGNVDSVTTGEWAIKTQDAIALGYTCVPDCPDVTPTPEPTLPNVGEPCVLNMPASISLANTGKSQVQVSLQAQPDGEVTVALASDCAFLDKCTLTFNPTNWNVPQSFGASNNPANPDGSCSLTLTATGTNDCEGSINVTKADAPKTESVSYGDPYVFTFDAVRFQLTQTTTGDDYYYLLRQPNGELICQTFVQPCAIGECNNGAAIRYRSGYVKVMMSSSGALTLTDDGSLEDEGASISQPAANAYLLTLNTQAAIRLTAEYIASMKVYSLRVSIRLGASYMGSVAGLVGNFNRNRNDERGLPNGSQAADFAALENGWKVPAGENLFTNPTATIGTILGAQPYTSQTFPFVCEAQ
jgi:hypothetical protein